MALLPYVAPESREGLLDLLLAIDVLLAANQGTQQAILTACPAVDPRLFDLAALQEWIELFSRDLRVIREEEHDGQGTITAQTGAQATRVQLRFRREAGRWVYVPGPLARDLPARVRDLARGLDRLTLVLSRAGQVTPQQLAREFEIRVQSELRRLREAASRPDPATGLPLRDGITARPATPGS